MSKYTLNGKSVPRVTEILQLNSDEEGLRRWRKRTPNWKEIQTRALTCGKIMHWLIANKLSAVPVEMDDELPMDEWPRDAITEVMGRMTQFDRLRMKFDGNPILEHVIYHDTPGEECGGTLDYRGNINGYKSIADWKGSNRIRPEYEIQVGAYYLGSIREGYVPERGFIVRLQAGEREVLEMDKERLEDRALAFRELARRWHKENGLSRDSA